MTDLNHWTFYFFYKKSVSHFRYKMTQVFRFFLNLKTSAFIIYMHVFFMCMYTNETIITCSKIQNSEMEGVTVQERQWWVTGRDGVVR